MRLPCHLLRSLILSVGLASATLAHGAPPSQFIAKTYTEGLGRAPTESEWAAAHQALSGTINVTTLRAWARSIYLSAEYDALYKTGATYDNEARVLTIYRGILNREPDPVGLAARAGALDTGTSWSATLDYLFYSQEFATLSTKIRDLDTYGFGATQASDLHFVGPKWRVGFGNSCSPTTYSVQELQDCLDHAAPFGGFAEVYLAQKAVFRLTTTLRVPSNVYLMTEGQPSHARYALMARLVRAGSFDGPLVRVETGGDSPTSGSMVSA